MPPYYPTAAPPPPTAGDRLDALHEALDLLGERLREGIALAVGRAVSGAASDAVLALLGHATPTGMTDPQPAYPPRPWDAPGERRPAPLWEVLAGEAAEDADAGSRPWEDPYAVPEPTPAPTPHRRRPWLSALAAGWQATRWWLARRPGRYPLLTALVVGGAAALGVFAFGPLAAAGVGVAGTALGLVALADAARSGAETLTGP